MLVCICLYTFGPYWVFDTPGAIFTQLKDWFGGDFNSEKNLMFYSIYSWPNTVLCLFGGYLCDRAFGIRRATVLFGVLIFAGQTLFALGVQSRSYNLALVGRFVYGLGGESMCVAQNTMTVRWFQGDNFILIFSIVLSAARVGSALNFVATPHIADQGVPAAVWFGWGLCGLSLVACVVSTAIDYRAEQSGHLPPLFSHAAAAAAGSEPTTFVGEMKKFGRQVRGFRLSVWLITLICTMFYVSILTFYTVASDIMQHTGTMYSPSTATMLIAIPNLSAIVLLPLFGRMFDRIGRAVDFLLMASLLMAFVHCCFFFNATGVVNLHPAFLLALVGVAYSCGASAVWPTGGRLFKSDEQGTGFGLMTAVQNIGLALFPMVIGSLQTREAGTVYEYTMPLLILMGCAGASALLCVWLQGVDYAVEGGLLNAASVPEMEEAASKKKVGGKGAEVLVAKLGAELGGVEDEVRKPLKGE